MARLPYVDPLDLKEEDRFLLERPINLFRVLANNPEAMKAMRRFGLWIRHECPLDPRLREMAILQVGYLTNCGYEFSHHAKIGRDFGVTPGDIAALIEETQGGTSGLPLLDREVLRAAREITRTMTLPDDLWQFLLDQMGRERLMELVMIVSHYNHVVRLLKTFRIDVEPDWAAPLDLYPSPEGKWQ